MTKQTTVVYGANRTLKITLPDSFWEVMFAMANLEGRGEDLDAYAAEYVKHGIIMDVIDDQGYFGELLCRGFKETLKDDPYYQGVAGKK
jgi:hypothetical protein